ncbi:hypothetical protein CCACVL1_27393 [Corchorus capsularis]|uniref:Uncharacterized protein n=1 Tax=Corchorus capsularis TaxID=210143 RepID=A0A1R3GAL2_COCAP|nr:hypothetical protein CCACVL1_27393 [Corchorus capsularis]
MATEELLSVVPKLLLLGSGVTRSITLTTGSTGVATVAPNIRCHLQCRHRPDLKRHLNIDLLLSPILILSSSHELWSPPSLSNCFCHCNHHVLFDLDKN